MKILMVISFITLSVPSYALDDATALKILKKSRCTTCHDIEKDKIGPSYKEVSRMYKTPQAHLKGKTTDAYLFEKVRTGTKKTNRNWHKSKKGKKFGIMTKNSKNKISDADLKEIIKYILSLK
ncbi:MAG: c-type cytochrome [Halobacteriovoraceae bacterium]|nr:c-type cytochrome [Halobacteriovoraceae bacterium]MCB9095826.1 c-type cytochrome [Halobacteriovoraceae bacterium]